MWPATPAAHRRRVAMGASLLAVPALLLALVTLDARARRSRRLAEQPAISAVVARLPNGDLALPGGGGARWLRSPSSEEPGAAFSDGPAVADPEPAGAALAPPRAIWVLEAKLQAEAWKR